MALALLARVSAGAVAAPVVDTKTSSPVTTITREQLEHLPTGRSVEDLLKICPARTIPTVTSQPRGDLTGAPASRLSCVQPDDLRMIDIYSLHNNERAAVGVRPLRWDFTLAADATAYAQQLARTGQLVHAPREGRGIARENLLSAPMGWSTGQMMSLWAGEKRYFRPGIYPNVCTGDWSQCAHYTQMIWPTTTDLGCGMAPGGGFEWLVCRYSPGGNKDGQAVVDGSRFASTGRVDNDFKYGFAYRNTPVSSETFWDWGGAVDNSIDVWNLANTGSISVFPDLSAPSDPLDLLDPIDWDAPM